MQIATPYSTGTGFLLPQYGLIVTNEHVVRDNREAIIEGKSIKRKLTKVLFIDPKLDIAFLDASDLRYSSEFAQHSTKGISVGERVYAVGHPFGLKFTATSGIVSNPDFHSEGVSYIQHDAALNPGNSGGPLIDDNGRIIGINTFIIQDGQNIGFSLPIHSVIKSAKQYMSQSGTSAAACFSCSQIIFDTGKAIKYCPHCGASIRLPAYIEQYQPIGMSSTIEKMLTDTGHDVLVARRGPNAWQIEHGSATIEVYYYEQSGLLTGEAHLCSLPKKKIKELYQFLLCKNYELTGLTFSVKQNDVILSLLIFDRYLNAETGVALLEQLFQQADSFDNILVEDFGAEWKISDQ